MFPGLATVPMVTVAFMKSGKPLSLQKGFLSSKGFMSKRYFPALSNTTNRA